jgi:hypothetical protein
MGDSNISLDRTNQGAADYQRKLERNRAVPLLPSGAVKVDITEKTSFQAPRKSIPAPSEQTIIIKTNSTRIAELNAARGDVSKANIVSPAEQEKREAAAKAAAKAERKAKRAEEKANNPSPKSQDKSPEQTRKSNLKEEIRLAKAADKILRDAEKSEAKAAKENFVVEYALVFSSGDVTHLRAARLEGGKEIAAAPNHAIGNMVSLLEDDKHRSCKLKSGVCLTLYFADERVKRIFCHNAEDAQHRGMDKMRAEKDPCKKFTVSDTITRGEVVAAARSLRGERVIPSRDRPILQKKKDFNPHKLWAKASQSRCSFSAG